MAESMIFYKSFRDAIKKCNEADALAAYEAILDYGLDGIEPKNIGSIPSMIFDLVKPQIDANIRRRESGKKGGRPHAQEKTNGFEIKKPMVIKSVNHRLSEEKPNGCVSEKPNVNVNDNDNVNDNVNVVKGKRASAFTPPDVSEVRSYCQERHNSVDPEKFVDFYASKGWFVGKNKMKDWKAAVRNWEKGEAKSKPITQAQDYIRSDYDIDAIERALVKNG